MKPEQGDQRLLIVRALHEEWNLSLKFVHSIRITEPVPCWRGCMDDVTDVLNGNRAAVDKLINAEEESGPAWSVPRASGRWSPSQVIEHVARALEESASVISGAPSKFPTLPLFIRPLLRIFFFCKIHSMLLNNPRSKP